VNSAAESTTVDRRSESKHRSTPGRASNTRCFSVKGDQNMGVGAMLQLMIDGAYAEFAFEIGRPIRSGSTARDASTAPGISRSKVGHAITPLAVFSYLHETGRSRVTCCPFSGICICTNWKARPAAVFAAPKLINS
jgi:hypothetical protein